MKLQYRLNPGSGKHFAYTIIAERLLKDDPLYTGTCDNVEVKTVLCDNEKIQMAVYCDENVAFVDKVECI